MTEKTERKFFVSKAVPDNDFTGVSVEGREMRFNRKHGDSFYLSDPAVARDLDQTLGHSGGEKKILVTEIPNWKSKDEMSGHYFKWSVRKRISLSGPSNYEWVSDGKGRSRLVRKAG